MERVWKTLRVLRSPTGLPLVFLAVGLCVAAATILFNARHLWFVGDDWDFLLHRGTVSGEANRGLFAPHNEHPSMAVIVVFRLLFSFFGLWHTPYGVALVLFHLALMVCIALALIRSGASRWISVSIGVLLAFAAAGADAVMWYTVISLVGSMLCAWALTAWLAGRDRLGRRELAIGASVLTLGWAFSGVGVSAAVFVACYVWLRHDWRVAARMTVVPAALFLLWFALIGHTGTKPDQGGKVLLQLPAYVWKGLSDPFTVSTGVPQIGTLLVLAAVLSLFVERVPARLRHLGWAGVVGAVVQLLIAGSGRLASGGIEQATTGRYAYLTLVFMAPAMAALLTWTSMSVKGSAVPIRIMAVVGVVAYAVNAAYLLQDYVKKFEPYTTADKNLAYGLRDAVSQDEKVLTKTTPSAYEQDFDATLLTQRRIIRELPRREGSLEQRVAAESLFMVAVGDNVDFKLAKPADLRVVYGFTPEIRPKSGCGSYQSTLSGPVLSLKTGVGNEVVVWSPSTTITTQIIRGPIKGPVRDWSVSSGKPIHIATTARGAELLIGFNGSGEYTICRL